MNRFIVLPILAILLLIAIVIILMLWVKRQLLEKEKKLKELENKRQVELIKAIVEAEETQKTKIASDLHDQIIPELTLAALNLSTLVNELKVDEIKLKPITAEIEKFANIGSHIREIAHGIIPKLFTSFGLVKSIENTVKQIDNIGTSKAVFQINSIFTVEQTLTQNQQLIIYRITLEILNNIRKHTGYNYLTVSLESEKNEFILVFTHDGKGIENSEIKELTNKGGGIGLKSLQSRILSLGGSIDYFREQDVSFITLKLPLTNENNN